MTQDQMDRLMELMSELNWDLFLPSEDMPDNPNKIDGMVIGTPERIKSLLMPQKGQMIFKTCKVIKFSPPENGEG